MITRLTNYLTALAFLGAMSVAYQNTFVPLVTPETFESVPIRPAQGLVFEDSVKDLFPEGSWQRGSCRCLQTADGMLLFQDWEQSAGDQWKLWPVTVVMGRGLSNEQSAEPLILEADQGAEIKFGGSLDVMSGGAPPIERGSMIGPVHVYRKQAAGSHENDTFDLVTSNVGIDRRKIWTTDDIRMSVGQAKLAGRDLTIDFAVDPSKASGADAASTLDRMELIYLEELILPLGPDKTVSTNNASAAGLANSVAEPYRFGSTDPPSDSGAASGSASQIPRGVVSIGCRGRVEYDFAIDQLVLRNQVDLQHQTIDGMLDRFSCDTLTLTLNDPTNDTIIRDGPFDWISKVEAMGSPAYASLESYNGTIAADNITFDSRRGSVNATGELGIRISRGSIDLKLANLDYQFDPSNPTAWGSLFVRGPGLVKISDPEIPVSEMKWKGGLAVRPVGDVVAGTDQRNIEVRGENDVYASFVDGGEFFADSIHGLFKPVLASEPNPQAIAGAAPTTTLVPDQFDVKGNVRIDTSALSANTDHLHLFVVNSGVENAVPSVGRQNQTAPASSSSLRQWVNQPQAGQPMTAPVARPRPTLRGDKIIASLRRLPSGFNAEKLGVIGNVEVIHQLVTQTQELPVRLSADKLQLRDVGGEDVLQLESAPESPARFDIGDGFFVGPKIQVMTGANTILIPEPGEFQIPRDLMFVSDSSKVDSSNITWTKPPFCRWRGTMTFDGQEIQLTGGVDLTAELISGVSPWKVDMQGDLLRIQLWNDVQLKNVAALRQAKVKSIILEQSPEHQVMVQAIQRAEDGVMAAKHLIFAQRLTMNPGEIEGTGTGMLLGQGPGWYRGWMPSSDSGPMKNQARATMIDDAPRPLTGIHLTFQDSMRAEMSTRSLDFNQTVRVGVAPVGHWEDLVDADRMDVLDIDQSTLDCEQLRLIVQPSTRGRPMGFASTVNFELQALDGILFRSRSQKGLIEGTASRAAYASVKDMFTAYGSPNRPAVIKSFLPNNTQRFEATVKSAVIHPKTMRMDPVEIISWNMAPPANVLRRDVDAISRQPVTGNRQLPSTR